MFPRVNSKIDFPQLEESILHFWKEHGIFPKSIEVREGKPRYIFYEGPPTANGSPGVHHVLSRLFKDAICRYKTMQGYCVPRKAGWDTHGLPVELQVEGSLGFKNKAQIEKYGIARFNQRCRESTLSYIKEWEAMTERIGFWLDMEHPYITLDNDYIESCWWIVKKLWDKGLIYQDYKVTPHCPRCGTSLSSHEVALGYKEADDPSVYVKFRVSCVVPPRKPLPAAYAKLFPYAERSFYSDPPIYFLAWTTTPWTLPGNTALAVAEEAEYTLVDNGGERLILASALLDRIKLQGYRVVDSFQGKDLVNFGYEPFYNPSNYRVPSYRFALFLTPTLHGIDRLVPQVLPGYFTYPIIAADFVSMEEGTGIVHVAPAFGEVDFEVGKDNGLDFVQPVDLGGQIIGSYPFSGKFVKDADELILADLEKRGLLYRRETIVHTYPFCWRCDAPLLYYAKRAWYIRTTAVKDKLISGNAEINWYPDYIKYGRFGDWLENNVDWAFSRERYWGTPLPIWHCESCGDYDCIGSMEELENKPGIAPSPIAQIFEKGELDLHRPYMDKITYDCPKCGGEMRRVPEVIDCWFDSGAMPIAQWHFPFENRDTLEQSFPADFVCEAVDQTRGWFYSLHALSTLLFEQPCFKNVICLGHIVDAQGKKMSKAEGNVIDPWAVINHHGADAIRWYLLTSAPAGNVRRFSTKMVTESIRKFLLTLWNTYSFFTLYANIDHFVPQPCHYDRNEAVSPTLLDKWIISELNRLIGEVTKGLDNYDPNLAARRIESFVDALSNWYVRQSRRRFWKSENDADKLAAYTTLYQCLVTLSQLLAPLTPFIAEELYQNLVRSVDSNAQESVHLTDFPVTDEAKIDDRLNEDVELAIKISSLGRAARAKAGIKVRQPLPRAVVRVRSEGEIKALQRSATEIMREVNIKEMEFSEEESLPDMPGYSVAGDARRWVAVSTELTPELVVEGISREVVRHLQSMRRAAKFDVADYIVTYYQAEEQIRRVMVDFADYIKQETLSYELIDCIPPEGAYSEKHRISDSDVLLAVKKVIQPHGGGLFSS